MASKTRKVSFYRLSLEKQTLLPGTRTVRVTQLNNSEIEDCFRKIYNEKMQVLSDNHKAINITASNGHYVIEAISFEDHNFTKTVVLGREDEGLLTLDDFKDALVNTYDLYKTELLRYCRS